MRISKQARNCLFLATTILAFTSCSIGPDYSQPKIELAENFNSTAGLSTATPVVDWWKSFQDPTLNRLVQLAINNNYDVDIIVARITESRASTWELILDTLPAITLGAGYNRSKGSEAKLPFIDNPSFRTLKYYNAGGDVAWEIDVLGRSRRAVAAARAAGEAVQAELDDLLVSLTAEIAQNYFDLRSTQRQLRIAKKQLRNQQAIYNFQKILFENGASNRSELLAAKNEALLIKLQIPALVALEQQFKNSLAVLSGNQPGQINNFLRGAKKLNSYQGPVNIGSPEKLLQRRPDLRIAERKLAQASEEIGVALGDIFPKINFAGSLNYEAISANDIGKTDPSYLINPNISWIAFDMGPALARLKIANVKFDLALLAYQQAVNLALQDVENSLATFSSEKQRYLIYTELTSNNKEISALERVRYQIGDLDQASALQARQQKLNSMLEKLSSKLALNKSLVLLYKSLGGGWQAFYQAAEFTPAGSQKKIKK